MAAVSYEDLFDGNSGRVTAAGWEFDRMAIVTGATGDGHAKIYNAATELGLSIGDAHPTVSDTKLRAVVCESIDTNSVRFRLLYRQGTHTATPWEPPIDTIEVGASLGQVETNKDVSGTVMEVDYTYPATYAHDTKLQSTAAPTQSALVSKLIPENTIIISKRQFFNPNGLAKEYVGTINQAGWNLDPTAAAETWLCTGIVGRSNDAGISYITTYSFQYRADTWDVNIAWIDPHDGRPPADLVPDTGLKSYQQYTIKNFNALNL
jgi:hypothetical protein